LIFGNTISTLGLTASSKRTIKSGAQYAPYFNVDEVKGNEVELMANGDVFDTLKQMDKIVRNTLPQTKAIAAKLKGDTLRKTCENIWNFLYSHVQYKKDNPLREQLRTPLRAWKDRKSGVDCDCYSIFISSVLTNLGIPHAFRMAGYNGDYQHVYVVVPKSGKTTDDRSSYYVIDPVVNTFDYEVPPNKKYNYAMAKVTMLNGFSGEEACNPLPLLDRLRRYITTEEVVEKGYVPTKAFLKFNNIPFQEAVNQTTNQGSFVIQTPAGTKNIPPIITSDQANAIKTLMAGPASSTTTTNPSTTSPTSTETPAPVRPGDLSDKKKFWLWWIAIGAGAWFLLTGSDQQEVKALGALPRKKSKPSKSKMKVVRI
jgi:hypothetical protein